MLIVMSQINTLYQDLRYSCFLRVCDGCKSLQFAASVPAQHRLNAAHIIIVWWDGAALATAPSREDSLSQVEHILTLLWSFSI